MAWYFPSGDGVQWGNGFYRGWVEAGIASSTDSTVTVYCRCVGDNRSNYGAGMYANTVINGEHVGQAYGAWDSIAYDWVARADTGLQYRTFARGGSAYNISAGAWFDAYNTGTGAHIGSQAATDWQTITIPALDLPGAPSAATNTRNSDSQNTVTWTNGSGARSNVLVERQIDGGVWSQIASLSGSATSYIDATTQTNHAYAYRVRSYNAAGYSSYSTSSTTYNSPAAPTAVNASRSGSTTVALAITNPAITATALEIQRSTDGATWTTITTVTGSAVTSATDTPGGGTFYYRARNTRGALVSDWSPTSNSVVTIIAPAAPTLITPASGVTISKAQTAIVLTWQHNPIDGSAQSAAELQYSINGGSTWTTVTLTTAQTYSLANSFAVNATVTWRVRTKGAHADYGAYSAAQTFKVCQVPSTAITTPAADGTEIIDVPIALAWSYSDQSGTQQRAVVTIKDSAGAQLWTKTITGAAVSASVPSSELLPANNATYSIELAVTSTSGLTASATRTFATDYEEPESPTITVDVDEEFGRVSLLVHEGINNTGKPATASLGIFRRKADGAITSLVDHVTSGTGATDPYPPLDQPLTYIAVAYTANGLTSKTEHAETIPSGGYVYFNFGAAFGDLAKVAMDVEWDRSVQIDKEVIVTEGNPDPLVFFGSAKTTEGSVNGEIWWRLEDAGEDIYSTAAAFERLQENTDIAIARFPFGRVVPATIECHLTTGSQDSAVSQVEVEVQKVRADGLVL